MSCGPAPNVKTEQPTKTRLHEPFRAHRLLPLTRPREGRSVHVAPRGPSRTRSGARKREVGVTRAREGLALLTSPRAVQGLPAKLGPGVGGAHGHRITDRCRSPGPDAVDSARASLERTHGTGKSKSTVPAKCKHVRKHKVRMRGRPPAACSLKLATGSTPARGPTLRRKVPLRQAPCCSCSRWVLETIYFSSEEPGQDKSPRPARPKQEESPDRPAG